MTRILKMHNRKIFIFLLIPILLITGGWVLFNKYIRPNHYQLLFPYTAFYGKTLAVTQTRTGKDNRVEILIPEGPAVVGRGEYETVAELDSFWIDQIPVTIGAYKQFIKETKKLAPRYRNEYAVYWQNEFYEFLPVTFVSWGQANDYCEYYGGHLATEAQWEKAARGPDGIILYWDDSRKAFNKANYDNFFDGMTPAGWLPKGKTYYGLLDMSGNVREWVLDWLDDMEQPVSLEAWQTIRDQVSDRGERMLKGGAYSDDVSHLRLNSRDAHAPNSPGLNRGFRCVYDE